MLETCLFAINNAFFLFFLCAATDMVKIKHLHSKLEEDVPVADLAKFLQAQLQPHFGVSGRPAAAVVAMRSVDDAEAETEGDGAPIGMREKERRRRDKR